MEPPTPLSHFLRRELARRGFSPRAISVLLATLSIPPGTTITYKELAARCGMPHGARAVARILKRNPFPLLIPCHRVVGTRSFGGYFGKEGTFIKRSLLSRERRLRA